MPYSVSGNAWPHPELVTLSFVPDGTNLGGVSSNLFATFNGKFGSAATWQNQILKAAQVWAQQTNLNFSLVSDSGADIGSGYYQQGDPGFGDIRIGGFNFGTNALGMAYLPPAINNYSVAGDIAFNTGQTFNIGSTYDLFTVAAHEIGHALGLLHSDTFGAVMYANYSARMTGLNSDDIAAIRNVYSNNNARSADAYNMGGANGSFYAAADISAQINTASETALLNNLDITTTSEKEYFKFTAPAGCGSTLTVNVQSSGLSLLAPTLTVYNGLLLQIGSVSGAGHYGTTLSLTISGITAGSTYYLKVGGADCTALGTGKYALTLNVGTGASPTVPLPNTQTANGNPPSGGGGQAFNPSIAQGASNASGGGLLGGLLHLVGTVVQDVLGILHDAAGAFDLFEAPGANPLSHSPGCCCPNCRQSTAAQQSVLAVEEALRSDPGFVATLSFESSPTDQQNADRQAAAYFVVAEQAAASAWQASGDPSVLVSFIAALQKSYTHGAGSWSQECDAFFAEEN